MRIFFSKKKQALVPAFSMFYLTISTYAPFGKSGRAPDSVRFPTGIPKMLNILFPGLPCWTFLMSAILVVPVMVTLNSNVT